jgi:hypothetical protein
MKAFLSNVPLAAFVAAVASSGFIIISSAILFGKSEEMTLLVTLLVLAVISEAFGFTPFPKSTVSISIAFIMSAGVVSGLAGVAVVASGAALASGAFRRKDPVKIVFNLGALLMTGAVFVLILELFSDGYSASDAIGMLAPTLAASLFAFAVNSGTVTFAISLDGAGKPLSVWNDAFRWLLPHYVILGSLAVLLALSYERWDMQGIALILIPLFMMWLVLKQYVNRPIPASSVS